MEIKKNFSGDKLTIKIIDRIDATSAPKLEEELNKCLEGVKELILDFSELEYISSAGLRTMVVAQKRMKKQGQMKIINLSDEVYEIFEITGFISFLNIER